MVRPSRRQKKNKALRLLRTKPHLTQKKIAELSGVSEWTIGRYAKDPNNRLLPRQRISKHAHFCIVCKALINKKTSPRFCTEKCRVEYFYVSIPCAQCGDSIKKQKTFLKRMAYKEWNYYCCRQCYRDFKAGRPSAKSFEESLKKRYLNVYNEE